MKTKFSFYLKIFFIIIFCPLVAKAEVYINEIMYDVSGTDSGREWVEVYNSGPDDVDFSKWRFLESADASNHSLTKIQGDNIIFKEGYVVIVSDPAKFLVDYPSFSGNIFKASFSSLNNTSGTLILKDGDLNIKDQVSYSSDKGANGDGNSLQKTDSGWISASPTPGLKNSTISSIPADTNIDNSTTTTKDTDNNSSSENTSAHSSPAPLSNDTQKQEFEVSAGRDRLSSVGNVLEFKSSITKIKNLSENSVNYKWSFGDGSFGQGKEVTHFYKFPGEYQVVLNASVSDKQAVNRILVKIIEPNILVEKISGGISILNKSQSEINLGGWILSGKISSFNFPEDTLIPSGKKIIFPDSITGISDNFFKISNPIGQIIFERKEVAEIVATTTKSFDFDFLQKEVFEIQKEVSGMNKNDNSEVVENNEDEKIKKDFSDQNLVEENVSTEEGKVLTSNVFEAKPKVGLVSKIFAWPIAGMNFIKNIFWK